jgi:putative component of toxin-antitoxin plasmid stabilization module
MSERTVHALRGLVHRFFELRRQSCNCEGARRDAQHLCQVDWRHRRLWDRLGRQLTRLERRNTSVKWIGVIGDYRIDRGTSCRLYFAKDGKDIATLFSGEERNRPQIRREHRRNSMERESHMKRRNDLDAMIDEAVVDCYTDSEMLTAMMTAIHDHLDLPFATQVLGLTVNVVALESNDAGEIVALCKCNGKRQRIPLLDLPLPHPPPSGAEWIAAFRRFARHQ